MLASLNSSAGPDISSAKVAAVAGRSLLRLKGEAPYDVPALLAYLRARALPGVEEVEEAAYLRTVRLPSGPAVVRVALDSAAAVEVATARNGPAEADLSLLAAACRRLLDLDASPAEVEAALGRDPALVPLLARHPGARVPGSFDGFELAVRAILGQQVSVAGANTLAGRLIRQLGEPLERPSGRLTHLFPTAPVLAEADLGWLGVPASRARALTSLAGAVASGRLALEPGADGAALRADLLALPGVGPWTAAYVALRALGDRDAFPASDLGLLRGAARIGLPGDTRRLSAHAARWSPWRAYAAVHLWLAAARPEP
jgi:AraC family transcriptional regulator, regulatory protein of adaptative response / DNA-3-methyladenine glycosylase II